MNISYRRGDGGCVFKTQPPSPRLDHMLELYELYCNKSNKPEDQRRYRVARAFYIDAVKADDIANAEGIDRRTCYRDTTDACAKLSALIFGIDGLSTMSQTCP